MASIVRVQLTGHLSTDANSLPQELVTALSQSVTSTALQSYGARFQAGLSMVRELLTVDDVWLANTVETLQPSCLCLH